jgi:hypothetical protein
MYITPPLQILIAASLASRSEVDTQAKKIRHPLSQGSAETSDSQEREH